MQSEPGRQEKPGCWSLQSLAHRQMTEARRLIASVMSICFETCMLGLKTIGHIWPQLFLSWKYIFISAGILLKPKEINLKQYLAAIRSFDGRKQDTLQRKPCCSTSDTQTPSSECSLKENRPRSTALEALCAACAARAWRCGPNGLPSTI